MPLDVWVSTLWPDDQVNCIGAWPHPSVYLASVSTRNTNSRVEEKQQRPCEPPSWKYLLPSLYTKCFADPWYKWHTLGVFVVCVLFCFFLRIFIYLFLERKGGKRGRETSVCGCLLCAPYWGSSLQPRHVPWLGINWRPFGSQAGPQPTEPHQPGQMAYFELSLLPSRQVVFHL